MSVGYHLQSPDDHCRCTIEHCVAVVNAVIDKRSSSECLPGIGIRTPDTVIVVAGVGKRATDHVCYVYFHIQSAVKDDAEVRDFVWRHNELILK